jgi:uncharacterized protein YukE
MQTGQVEQIVTKLNTAKKALTDAETSATNAATTLKGNWHGPDSDRFQKTWTKDKQSIQDAITAVNGMVTKLNKQIADQKAASK